MVPYARAMDSYGAGPMAEFSHARECHFDIASVEFTSVATDAEVVVIALTT